MGGGIRLVILDVNNSLFIETELPRLNLIRVLDQRIIVESLGMMLHVDGIRNNSVSIEDVLPMSLSSSFSNHSGEDFLFLSA